MAWHALRWVLQNWLFILMMVVALGYFLRAFTIKVEPPRSDEERLRELYAKAKAVDPRLR